MLRKPVEPCVPPTLRPGLGVRAREIQNATRGSSSIEFTVDALYCAEKPKASEGSVLVAFRCLKQREGPAEPLEFTVDGRTGMIEEGAP